MTVWMQNANCYIALPSGGFGNEQQEFAFSHPSEPIRREGYIILSPHRKPRQYQGIMMSGPCLNMAVVLFHSAAAEKPRCAGKPNPALGLPATVLDVGHTERVKLDLGRPERVSV
jgi:hypothetical protein